MTSRVFLADAEHVREARARYKKKKGGAREGGKGSKREEKGRSILRGSGLSAMLATETTGH